MGTHNSIKKGIQRALLAATLSGSLAAVPALAAPVYLANYTTDFTAYDYNTAADWSAALGFIGCGPTTGAMILNYFQNHDGAAGLMEAGGGLATAQTLHGPGNHLGSYMQTGTDGFGSVYRIEPGMQDYATSKGYNIDVMIHVSAGNVPPSASWDPYGAYGSAWTNDGNYFVQDGGGNWSIDDALFYNFMSAKLAAGIPIFLTVDSDGDGSGDHWIPMVGVDLVNGSGTYYYYNTWDTTLHSAAVKYIGEGGNTQWAISLARTVTFIGPIDGGDGNGNVPEPGTLALLALGLAVLFGFGRRSRAGGE